MSEKNNFIIDLFSGAGGLSLGFEMANFKVDLAIELEENYYRAYKGNHPETLSLNKDITDLNCKDFSNKYLKNKEIKGIIGGPPCIGFSTVGNRRPDDPRNMLIFYFIQWIEHFKPKFFVMENVPGILSMGNGKVVEKVFNLYKEIGYACKMETLLAADYGVPQDLGKNALPSYLTVQDAISDILSIEPFTKKRTDDMIKKYSHQPKTRYQKYLRKNSTGLYDHFAPNHSELVMKRISHINQGMNHSSLPKEYQLKGGYPNIYGRLHLNKPADTITGNCGCVSAPGRFIHPTQNRAISIREAARLQSFPDNYRFCGSMRDKYKQVGNAVPPLMAYAVAKSINQLLKI